MNLVNDEELREQIVKRMKEIDVNQAFIYNDAAERGFKIDPSRLSKYLKGKKSGMTEEQVLWVATRLCIPVIVGIGIPVVDNNKISFRVGKYDEITAIKMLNRIFVKPNEKNKIGE